MITNKEKRKWLKKLRPFLASREIHYGMFKQAEFDIEKKMRKELGEELEFFYVDGECVGIGHCDWERRKKDKNYFPLFHYEEIESGKLNEDK
jgi:hypothetical protein